MSDHDMREEIECAYSEEFPKMLFMDGLYLAIIGVAQVHGNPVVAYSMEKILEELILQGMVFDEAKEFMSFNIMGAFMGKFTPLIIDDLF